MLEESDQGPVEDGAKIFRWMIIALILMTMGLIQRNCYLYRQVESIVLVVAIFCAVGPAIAVFQAMSKESYRLVIKGVRVLVTLRRVMVTSLIVFALSILAFWATFTFLIGDIILFQARESHTLTVPIVCMANVRGCGRSMSYDDEFVSRRMSVCVNNQRPWPNVGDMIRVRTEVGALGIRFVSAQRLDDAHSQHLR